MATTLLTLRQASATLPAIRGEKPPHPATLYRWATVGLVSKSGQRVRLAVQRVGGTVMTSPEALAQFFTALDDAELVEVPRSASVEQRQQEKRAQRALDYLKSEGVI